MSCPGRKQTALLLSVLEGPLRGGERAEKKTRKEKDGRDSEPPLRN